MRILAALLFVGQLAAQSELIDRIAVVVEQSIIKDSDIDRNLRATAFLNREPLQITPAKRKDATQKLIDQLLLRREIRTGGYGQAKVEDATQQVASLKRSRFRSESDFQAALAKYRLDEADLAASFRLQLTILRFIDARFKPAVVISDEAANAYYAQHENELRRSDPKGSEDDLRERAREILTGEEVNRQLDSWLNEQRKETKIHFLEDGLT